TSFVYVFFVAAMMHWFASASGAGGNAKGFLVLTLSTWLPYTLLLPLALAFQPLNSAGWFLFALAELIMLLIFIGLNAIALQENYRMPFDQSLLIAISPILVAMGLMIVGGFAMGFSVMRL